MQKLFTLVYITNLCSLITPSMDADALHGISKRFVLFPQYSVFQITAGLSVPMILRSRTINFSHGFILNPELPYDRSNFDPVYDGRENVDDFGAVDFDRRTMYEYAVAIMDAYGLDGETCLLRAICEVSEFPMHIEDDTSKYLLEQIVHYLLTPSKDFNTNDGDDVSLEHKVLVAEGLGKSHGNCYQIFKCPVSLLDLFTNKYY